MRPAIELPAIKALPDGAALGLIFFKTSQMLQRGICHGGVA